VVDYTSTQDVDQLSTYNDGYHNHGGPYKVTQVLQDYYRITTPNHKMGGYVVIPYPGNTNELRIMGLTPLGKPI